MNPYAIIPPIGRVLAALWTTARELGQQTFQISNRRLATAADCKSASGMPAILRQLAEDGHIQYDPTSSMIMLLSTPAIDSSIDHELDRPIAHPRAVTRSRQKSDHAKDRVKPPCMVHESHELSEGGSERASAPDCPFPHDPEWPHWEALGVIPEAYTDLRTDFPSVTLDQFTFWCQALANKKSPAGFVIYSLRNRLPLPRQRTQAGSPPTSPPLPDEPLRPRRQRSVRGYTGGLAPEQIAFDAFAHVPPELLAEIEREIEAAYGPQ